VSIEKDTWQEGVAGASANATHRRSPDPLALTIDGLAESINCFKSGSSDNDVSISGFVDAACTALVGLLVPSGGKPAAKGDYQLWKSTPVSDVDKESSFIQFGATFTTDGWNSVDTDMCQSAFQALSYSCQNSDGVSTKGGILTVGNVIQFTADPTDYSSNR
jgi:hypothetical protein